MRYLACSLIVIVWLAATVVLALSMVGIFVLILSETWWEIPQYAIRKMEIKRKGGINGNS